MKKVDIKDVPEVAERLRKNFILGKSRTVEWRMKQLQGLKRMFQENSDEITKAVQKDLGKAVAFEIIGSEINIPLTELDETMRHLKRWLKPEEVTTNLVAIPATSSVVREPTGTVLIISPWNYPVNLAIVPLIGAVAAGNTVFLKLSRHSANTGRTLEKLIPKHVELITFPDNYRYVDNECIRVESEGGAPMITELLKEKWDHIFFTGSVSVGRVVYEAAAKHLTPCTLELGGKNPCIVDSNVDIDLAAKRLVWGKLWNCGQTCIAPDYLLVQKNVEAPLIKALKKYIHEFHGQDPQKSKSFCRVVNNVAWKRLKGLLECGEVVEGGTSDEKDLYIAPTIIKNVPVDSPLMTDEIFGPVLPLIPYNTISDAIDFINKRPLPLALYCFTRDKSIQDKVITETRSGAAVMNDTILHFTNPSLPFGGVGDSGLGAYHGKLTFDTFTHRKPVIRSTSYPMLDIPLRYPPYTPVKTLAVKLITSGTLQQVLYYLLWTTLALAIYYLLFK